MIEERVKSFIKKYDISGTVLVAFSGGFDSMCLLDVLYKLEQNVIAIHLNHNWRGEESLREEHNCRDFAEKRGITFYSEILPDNVLHTENAARDERYKFFERCAEKFDAKYVFTAHNFNDNAETVLYRIIKGTGTFGLQGISEKRDIFYRPLLSTSRKEIEEYCKQNKLNPNYDSSNDDTKYKRNLIRKEILPLMEKINPNVIGAINSLSQIAEEDFECKNSDKYFVRQLLIDNNLDYDREKIEEISEFIMQNKSSKSGRTMSLSKDLWLFVNKNDTKIISQKNKRDTKIFINKEGEYRFENKVFFIKKFSDKIKKFTKDIEFKAYISVNNIDFTLRYRSEGDYIYPLGLKGKQKLKKYLNEKKVPKHEKDDIILLCKGQEVLWVSGCGISDKIKVTDKPTHIIELRG